VGSDPIGDPGRHRRARRAGDRRARQHGRAARQPGRARSHL